MNAATLKANKTAAKNEKGDGMKSPKSILHYKGKPVTPNLLPKKESVNINVPAQDANNNFTACDNKKMKPKMHRISFDGNKERQRINSRK